MIDTHCHILPGVDDGAVDMETSLRMAEAAAADGIKTVVATPHIIDGIYGAGDIGERLEELRRNINEQGTGLRLEAGAEVAMSYCLAPPAELRRLSVGGYLLMETADATYEQLRQASYQVRLAGLYPVLAHPERVSFVQDDPEKLRELVGGGEVFCQLTAASLEGAWGKKAGRVARRLIGMGAAHMVASDAHSSRARPPRLSGGYKAVGSEFGMEAAHILFNENPARMIEGRALESLTWLVDAKKGFLRRRLGR